MVQAYSCLNKLDNHKTNHHHCLHCCTGDWSSVQKAGHNLRAAPLSSLVHWCHNMIWRGRQTGKYGSRSAWKQIVAVMRVSQAPCLESNLKFICTDSSRAILIHQPTQIYSRSQCEGRGYIPHRHSMLCLLEALFELPVMLNCQFWLEYLQRINLSARMSHRHTAMAKHSN